MSKRFLAILLAVVMVFSMFTVASAAGSVFSDVPADEWYTDEIHWAYELGLMDGVDTATFAPNGTLTRGMIVTVLWRLEGKHVVNYAMTFEDVAADQWYTEAVRWAASVGIVDGYSDTAYGPNDKLSREQMATILWRYAKHKDIDVSSAENADVSGYTDFENVSDWAVEAMKWACAEGIINGVTDTSIDPTGFATRAQTAVILYRFHEEVITVTPDEPDEPDTPSTGGNTGGGGGGHRPPSEPSPEPSEPPVEEHEHSYTYTPNYDGTHDGTCNSNVGTCDVPNVNNVGCDYENDVCKYCEYAPAAKIGSAYYYTLEDAIEVVENNGTIVLLKNNSETDIVVGREVSFNISSGTYTYSREEITADICYSLGDSVEIFDFVLAPVYDDDDYISNNNGTHNCDCACGEHAIINQACEYGNDNACDKCGYTQPHTHAYTYTSNYNGTHDGFCANSDGLCNAVNINDEFCSFVEGGDVCICGFNRSTAVAKIYDEAGDGYYYYATLQSAIEAAADGATIDVLAVEIDTEVKVVDLDKSITIQGVEGTKLTAGMYLGYYLSGSYTYNHEVVVKGIAFENKGLRIINMKNVTVEGNTFTNITSKFEGEEVNTEDCFEDAIYVSSMNAGGYEGKAIIKDNVVNGAASVGINLRAVHDAEVTGNKVANTNHNSLQVVGDVTGEVNVTGNTLENWGLADNDGHETPGDTSDDGPDGRAFRGEVVTDATITFTKNVMKHADAPEEFVKVTGTGTATANGNYWAGAEPASGDDFVGVTVESYYTDDALQNLVTIVTNADQLKAALVLNGTVKLANDIPLTETVTVPAGSTVTLDLNGYTISGTKTAASYSSLIHVENGGALTVKDSSAVAPGTVDTGKITYDAGVSDAEGAVIWNEGSLILESGTLETTSTWHIGYAVDVRPNAWGTAYTNTAVSFVMNGGLVKTSDAAIRVSQNSPDSFAGYSVSFTMNDGEINSAATGIALQQATGKYDDVTVTINGGAITASTAPLRFQGDAVPTGLREGNTVGSSIIINGGTIAAGTGSNYTWVVNGIIRYSGSATLAQQLGCANVTVSEVFAQANSVLDNSVLANGYKWVAVEGGYKLAAAD